MHQFVARQPIFDARLHVQAYELLFRSDSSNRCPDIDADRATSSVIENFFFGPDLEALIGAEKAFINFPRKLLVEDYGLLLPPEKAVVEVLEDIEPDDEVLAAVRRLKDNGNTVAMDDFVAKDRDNPLVDLVDLIKVDFSLTTPDERQDLARRLLPAKIRLLAEKVETHEEYQDAASMGYTLFQGYFYCRPTMLKTACVPKSNLHCIRLLEAVNRPAIDLESVEEIIRTDLAFSFKLLRFINSAHFGLYREISSIREALIVLGELRLRKWASLVSCASLADDKPSELLATAIARGRFCELLADPAGQGGRENDLFLIGMFSMLDALLDQPMDSLLQSISLSSELKETLRGDPNRLRSILDLVLAFENGDWAALDRLTRELQLSERILLPALYIDSIKMASEMLQLDHSATPTQ